LEPAKEALLIKLFVGHLVPPGELVQLLQQQRSLHAENLVNLRVLLTGSYLWKCVANT
jgi:hypothetical protein